MNVDYSENNEVLFCKLSIEDLISGYEKDSILELAKDKYYIECFYDNDLTTIEIHKKY